MSAVPSSTLVQIAQQYGTPAWVYDAEVIRRQIARLRRFDVIRYAQKANSNIHLLRLMKSEGVLVDAVSLGEVERALAAGYTVGGEPSPIVFTADLLDRPTLARVVALKLPVNAIIFSTDGLKVAAIEHGNRVALKTVALGRDFGSIVEVVSGLEPGDEVVVNPPDSIAEGQTVRVVAAPDNER